MVVASMVMLGGSELLGSSSLSRGVQVLDLGLTENTVEGIGSVYSCCRIIGGRCLHVGVAVGGLVDLRGVDNEEDL